MNNFYVGQEVVCIDVSHDPRYQWQDLGSLKEGNIYKITWVGLWSDSIQKDLLCIQVEGISRPNNTPFRATRFRPLVEKKTDISVFQKLLVPKEKVLENVD